MTQISDEMVERAAWALAEKVYEDEEGDPPSEIFGTADGAEAAFKLRALARCALTAALGAAPDHVPDAGKMVGPWPGPSAFTLNVETTLAGTTILSPEYPGLLIFNEDIAAAFARVPAVVATIHKLEGGAAPAAEAVTGRDEWQPIETAPRDGTWILGWAQSDSAPYRVSWGRNHDGRLAWCTAFSSFVSDYLTDWRPLPAPRPSVAEVAAEGP